MSIQPLPDRINQAAWAVEWPLSPRFGEGKPLPRDAFPPALELAWHAATGVMGAIAGETRPVPLDQAHRFLDDLEAWTRHYRALLTWPASVLSFAQALRASAQRQDPRLVAVLVAYPNYCLHVLEAARTMDPSLPPADALFDAPVPPAQGKPSPADPPSPSPAKAPARHERHERFELPANPPAFLVGWVARVRGQKETALARTNLDQDLKSALSEYPGTPWQWFQKVLLPGLATLAVEDLQVLARAWPSHNRFLPPDPVELMDSPWFWVIMREAGMERREALSTGVLASVLDMDEATPATFLAMAAKMLPFVSRKPSAFRQRLRLWQSFGGDLDARVEPGQVEGVQASSVREWIAAQGNEEWDAVMASLPKPASEPRFRRGPAG